MNYIRAVVLTALVCFLSLCGGCSSVATEGGDFASAPANPLEAPVTEYFDGMIRDRAVRHYLFTVEEDRLTKSERLEVIILREIAQATTRDERIEAFDRLWRNEEIRQMFSAKIHLAGYENSVAEMFFLLSCDPGSSWKKGMADTLFLERFSRIDPEKFGGYGLHFYTLGLLQSGRMEEVAPLLERLYVLSPEDIHLKNLVFALGIAEKFEKTEVMCRLMVTICRICGRGERVFPDKQMVNALDFLEEKDDLRKLRAQLLSVAKGPVDQTAFAAKLTHLETASAASPPRGRMPPAARDERVIEKSSPRQSPFSVVARPVKGVVLVKVQVIRAGKGHLFIDPALDEVAASLLETLNVKSLRLEGEASFFLSAEENGEMNLPDGSRLLVTPGKIDNQRSELQVVISKNGSQLLHTRIESDDGGVTILGGPRHGSDVLLLRLSVFLGGEKVV